MSPLFEILTYLYIHGNMIQSNTRSAQEYKLKELVARVGRLYKTKYK